MAIARDYPLRSELRRLAGELRHLPLGRAPLPTVEMAQHHIVRLDDAASVWPDALDRAAATYLAARAFLKQCAEQFGTADEVAMSTKVDEEPL